MQSQMDYYGNNDWRDYHLSHHGILGMKWGVRRFQPYSVNPRKSGESGKEVGEAKKYKESLNTKRLRRSVRRLDNDIDSLKTHGYAQEAEGVRAVREKQAAKLLKSEQADYDRALNKNFVKIYNDSVEWVNNNIGEFNKKWEKEFAGYKDWSTSPKYREYEEAANKLIIDARKRSIEKFLGKRPT